MNEVYAQQYKGIYVHVSCTVSLLTYINTRIHMYIYLYVHTFVCTNQVPTIHIGGFVVLSLLLDIHTYICVHIIYAYFIHITFRKDPLSVFPP